MRYKNLNIIGTSHIAKQSVDSVKNTILKEKPDIIALELDKNRLYGLMHNQKRKISITDISKIGFKGFLFSWIGSIIQKKLGDYVGVTPGSEIKTAIRLAKKQKARIALIDQNIETTLKRFSKALTWKEKWNLLVDIFKGVVLRKNELEDLNIEKFDLTKVPSQEVIRKLINKMRERYPNICRVLIDERNKIMARNLSYLMNEHPEKNILAVVGAGHEEEIVELIKKDFNYKISYSLNIENSI
ncbi:MAG: TraB/GumN family protein [Nanoarchaeota archaeon]|nr:TraB/GumN family protein [Nanoarchaeota archaeon]